MGYIKKRNATAEPLAANKWADLVEDNVRRPHRLDESGRNESLLRAAWFCQTLKATSPAPAPGLANEKTVRDAAPRVSSEHTFKSPRHKTQRVVSVYSYFYFYFTFKMVHFLYYQILRRNAASLSFFENNLKKVSAS